MTQVKKQPFKWMSADFSLSPAELERYQTDGFLVRPQMFTSDELIGLVEAVEIAVDRARLASADGETYFLDHKRFVDVGKMTVQFEHEAGSATIRVIEPAGHLHIDLERLMEDPRLVQPVTNIIGQREISLWTNKLNLKRPGVGSGFGWHQDSPYWIHNCNHVDLLPNVYLAFDEATTKNGCLRVIRGSHRSGCLPGTADGSQLGGFFTDPAAFDLENEACLEIPAGSLVFFDPHIIHGSGPNHSDMARRAMIVTYQPAGFPMLKTGEIRNVEVGEEIETESLI